MKSHRAKLRPWPWNKGKLDDQNALFKLKKICAIRARLHMPRRFRELALFALGIDSKSRSPNV